jgi:hypothetical protein
MWQIVVMFLEQISQTILMLGFVSSYIKKGLQENDFKGYTSQSSTLECCLSYFWKAMKSRMLVDTS